MSRPRVLDVLGSWGGSVAQLAVGAGFVRSVDSPRVAESLGRLCESLAN
jgi:hypothetical protein